MIRARTWSRLGLLVAAFAPAWCSADVLRVAVASNFMQPMQVLVEHFAAASGHDVRLSFGSSGSFYAQIANGAPFDLLLSADRAIPERLEREGKAVPGSRITYARGRLVLWSADNSLIDANSLEERPERLHDLPFRRLALANPTLAPYGRAAQQLLARVDPQGAFSSRLVRGDNVGQAFLFVSTGNAELGFVALAQVLEPETQALRSGSGWIIPEALHDPIEQDAVLLQAAAGKRGASELLDFLRSKEGREIIARHGYATPD